ncbi:MAG TPA: Nif3-like dinuclear metal center hexameric protein [Bryobacteraceae bacterium]|nr:Nif3-like dinuclear metal center hexameric protein [Bryobacteraceae bacterium]
MRYITAIGCLVFPLAALAAAPPTARQVIERIQKQVGVPWSSDTVDTFKAGDPDTPVTGIATTFMATMEVLERAAASGKNLVIAHEPTFYNHLDKTESFTHDAVFETKRAFIEKHHMVVWRFHDHWHARVPDGINEAMIAALGWKPAAPDRRLPLFTLPATPLASVAADLRKRLGIRTLRVVGDPQMKITKAALVAGAAGAEAQIRTLRRDDVELLLVGETTEWETIPYVRDAVSQGRHKALILLGHVPSEEPGMENCARWLRTFVSEVPVEFIPAGEPFWEPK